MAIRYATVVLTVAGSLALVFGLLLWGGLGTNLMALHMLFGFLAVGALWIVAVGQALGKNGNWPIAFAALLLGGVTIWLGTTQTSLMSGDRHWIVQVIHLLLGVALIGLGHVATARQRRPSAL